MSKQVSTDVFEAAASGDLDTIKTLGRIHLEAKNDRGWTPLMFAARYGHPDVVEYLLSEAKVDPTVISKDGKTAAELAEFWGSNVVAVFDRLAPNKAKVQHSSGSPFAQQQVSTTGKHGMADWWKRRTVHQIKPLHFTGGTHHRQSFLRTDKEYLQASIVAPSTRFMVLAVHGVMFKSSTRDLAFASYDDIKDLIGPDPLNNLPEGLVLVFLGADESQQEGETLVGGRRGIGYWALDVSVRGSTPELKDAVEAFLKSVTEKHGHYMAEMRPAAFALSHPESGLVAQARAVVDWNKRNRFCAACGRKNVSLDGGHKRSCPSTITVDGKEVSSECLAHKGVQNFAYPRTDAVVIVCVISPDGERVLLGRQATWPKGVYSCLAGFVEPGESVEEAARREVKEESGITLGHVMYHSSQPWPFPNSLMLGCHAEALNEDPDITKEDKELEDARWFTRAQILESLQSSSVTTWGTPAMDDLPRMPPAAAIAHHLLRSWAMQEGEISYSKI
ncbi:Peroxisomal NADH pyrophosphatase nudt12 [Dissophora globulifera]|uniref:NAD-capped RNA hydrolase NUDT12 n=1 Tax=Dissophora globulifera TaxID=979702 RepID=A0A9P6UXR4_9FUNG|nr:Peroxisomal NADH pyrophosphatase nudt12 [Dissophora globulifera]